MGLSPAFITKCSRTICHCWNYNSEFFGRFKDFSAKVNASVPLPQLTAYLDPQ